MFEEELGQDYQREIVDREVANYNYINSEIKEQNNDTN